MNLLIVTPYYHPQTGGVVTAVEMLSQQFARQGNRIAILVPGETNRVLVSSRENGLPAYGLYCRVPFVRGAVVRGLLAFCVFLPITLVRLCRFTTEQGIDAVNIQYPLPWMFYFAILRKICSWKLIVTLQGNDVHDLPKASLQHRWLVKRLLRSADAIIGVSRSLLDELSRIFPGLAQKTAVIANGAPLPLPAECAPFFPYSDRQISGFILTVGHVIHRKGIDLILRAMKMARECGCDLKLIIVGDGPERANLSRLADDLGLRENVHFAGNQPHSITLEFFRRCLFFVLASREEGLPLVLVEAMAHNKAVVATRVDGIPELVKDGLTGLLAEPENPASLAAALVKLYKNKELRENVARRGQELVLREYTWDSIAARYIAILSDTSQRFGATLAAESRR